jgi:hypothetical protein
VNTATPLFFFNSIEYSNDIANKIEITVKNQKNDVKHFGLKDKIFDEYLLH